MRLEIKKIVITELLAQQVELGRLADEIRHSDPDRTYVAHRLHVATNYIRDLIDDYLMND